MTLDIDPKVDYAFKHLFGREETRPLLIDLINQVLNPAPGHHVQDVELLNPFNPKESLDGKLSILDIKARDQSGRQFNVEMQMLLKANLRKRIAYYVTKLHQQQLHEGEDYSVLKPTISIVFLNEEEEPNIADHHLCYGLLEKKHHIPYSEDLEIHVLEPPKFKKTLAELSSGLDYWLYFLKHAEKMDPKALPEKFSVPPYNKAVKELDMLSQNEVERERYESRRKGQLDYITDVKAAESRGKAEGKAEGLAKGNKIGAIQVYERLLQRPVTPTEQLQALLLEELTKMADDLQNQASSQR